MTNIERYKKEVCINCANEQCTNNIKEIRTQDITIEQISTTTIVRCDDFMCKNRRKKKPCEWQKWQESCLNLK